MSKKLITNAYDKIVQSLFKTFKDEKMYYSTCLGFDNIYRVKTTTIFPSFLDKGIIKIKDASKIQIISTIYTQLNDGVNSICVLKDKRLVLDGLNGSIEVYNKAYESQFHIENAHPGGVYSLCVLRNGELVSGGKDKEIKVWRIDEDDYQLIHTLKAHTDLVSKIIELKDGKISSCSNKEIKIWYNYKCIQTLNNYHAYSIIEMNNFIISASSPILTNDDKLKIWDESTYECIKTIQHIQCQSKNGLSKLNENTFIVGDWKKILLVNIKTYEINQFKDESLGDIYCLYVNGNGLVFVGNGRGEILCYDSSFNQIVFKSKFHNNRVKCIIGSEDNKLISTSYDKTINIYN